MELRHLRSFVTAADLGSFSKAASLLRLSQPALSRQILDLEAELGVRLFDRTGRRIRLTTEGEELLERGLKVLADAEALGERAHALRGGRTGILRVGATAMTLESFLPRFLSRYQRSHPEVEVRLTEEGGPRLLGQVERGELHLAVTLPIGAGLRSHLLFPVRILAVMASSHRLRRRRTVELSDLADEPLLVLRRDFGTRQLLEAACRIAHLAPQIVLEGGVAHALVALARVGCGVAVVPSNLRFDRGPVHAAPIVREGKALGAWMAVNWDPRRFLPPYAEVFVRELAAYARGAYPGREYAYAPPIPRADGRGLGIKEIEGRSQRGAFP